ncbi:hypothetical protein [Paenibacillus lacisoli]|nr:hypothetical protein [Paenibacillus sp. JX-17]
MNHVRAAALPDFAVFGASLQAADEEIHQSAPNYIRYICEYQNKVGKRSI